MNKFSFQNGFGQVLQRDIPNVKRELMAAFNIHNRTSWGLRLKGKIEPKASEVESVTAVFNRYGIFEIWGDCK